MAGRDIGTVILPDARLKIWLNASLEERARRRAEQTGEALAAVLERMAYRDQVDGSRAAAPMTRASDAIEVATDGVPLERVIAHITRLARERGAQRGDLADVMHVNGLLVASVDAGSDLARAGLRAGDRILAIDTLVPRDVIDLQLELPGARRLTLRRDAEPARAPRRPRRHRRRGVAHARGACSGRHSRVQQPL